MRNRTIAAVAAVCLSAATLIAQSSRGTVDGRIVDSSLATVAGAQVELRSLTTGVIRTTISNEAGNYRFDAVDLGNYQITVNAGGFQQWQTQPFGVVANQVRTVDAKLDVGEQKSVVQVVSETVQLQAEAPLRGSNIDSTSI